MIEKVKEICDKYKDKIAYIVNDDFITYEDLWYKANELANSLCKQGNTPVILYGNKSIDMIISIVASLISNRAYVPIDLHVPIERIEKIVETTNSTLIIKTEDLFYKSIECLSIDEVNEKYRFDELNTVSKNDIAYIIFTSGSTGEPKGVPILYNNLNNFVKWISSLEPLCEYENINVLNQASFSFDLSVADFYYSIFNGHTLVALDKKSQEEYGTIFEVIRNRKINFMVMTPTFIKLLLLNPEFNENNFQDLKCMYFCGEQLEVTTVKKLKKAFQNIEVINAYGPTEATSAVSAINIAEDMLESNYLPVGDVRTAAVKIDIENDEIVLSGESVFSGYLGDYQGGYFYDKGTNCYRTGDIGYIEKGLLYCKGRKDNQIKYKGYRIELGDIENNFLKVEGIREAVVVAKYTDTQIVKNLKAFITLEKDIDISEIKKKLKEYLPEYMIPTNIVILKEIPINKNGKYDRKKLQEI